MLKSEIPNLQQEISKSSIKVDDGLSADLIEIMSSADKLEVSPFMIFFWEKQKKYLNVSCKASISYHPVIIRYCLALLLHLLLHTMKYVLMKKLGLPLLSYLVKEDFEIMKIISIQMVLTMK